MGTTFPFKFTLQIQFAYSPQFNHGLFSALRNSSYYYWGRLVNAPMEQRNLFSTPWQKKRKNGKRERETSENNGQPSLTLRALLTKCAHSTSKKQTFAIVITFFLKRCCRSLTFSQLSSLTFNEQNKQQHTHTH